jgi:hypothetical protein
MRKIVAALYLIVIILPVAATEGMADGNFLIRRDGPEKIEDADKGSGHMDRTDIPAGETRKYNDRGLNITVIKMPDEISGHKTFEVTIENLNAVKKSLNGRICLFDLRIKQADCGSGECPVYMEIPAKSKVTKKWNCREKSFFSAWTFIIVQVYDY